jgi:hypothetical protein
MCPMSDDESHWITTEEAVELSGYNRDHIRRLMRNGQISGRKVVTVWQIDRSSLINYLASAEAFNDKRWGPKQIDNGG